MTLRAIILTCLTFCFSFAGLASDTFDIPKQIDLARSQSLSDLPQWHKLLHYKPTLLSSRVKSDVSSDTFFLSPKGRTNPEEELYATIGALLSGKTGADNTHAVCRFPARYKWLKSKLNWSRQNNEIQCPQYDAWRMEGRISSISMIFASGHMSNPASHYGHILLKFNTTTSEQEADYLDTSLNFGAIVPENENGLVYVLKGLFGGYKSTFTHQSFYKHNHNYVENELRDLWNYQLNLPKEKVEIIIDHSWELVGKEFTYYFLKQNCGYRMAELLNTVIDKPLLPSYKDWAMPSDILGELAANNPDYVNSIHRIPSRQNAFREKYQTLDGTEKDTVRKIINQPHDTVTAILNDQQPENIKRITTTLFDYYAFLDSEETEKSNNDKIKKNLLLRARLEQDTNAPSWSVTEGEKPPHKSQHSSMLKASYLYSSALGSGVEYRFRGAYYDHLSLAAGKLPFSQLSMGDISFVHRNGSLDLRKLEILNIETLNLSPTNIKADGGNAWKLRLGIESRSLDCDNCRDSFVEGGYGKGYQFSDKTAVYGFAQARLNAISFDSNYLQAGGVIGLLTGYGDFWKSHIKIGYMKQIDGPGKDLPFFSLENRFGNSKSWDVRIGVEHNQTTEFKSGISFYW